MSICDIIFYANNTKFCFLQILKIIYCITIKLLLLGLQNKLK